MLLPGRAFPVTETLQGELVGGDRGHGQVSFDRCCTFRRQCGYSALPVGQLYCTGTCFSEQAFKFRITPGLLLGGLIFSALMGAAGGLLPAIRAARIPVARALREI